MAFTTIAKSPRGGLGRAQMSTSNLTNEIRGATRTYWFVVVNGQPVARLCKQAKGFARWSVLKGVEWKQFASRDDAMAFAVGGVS